MNKAEQDALYEDFRSRLIEDMSKRLVRDNGILNLFGRFLSRWSTELVLTKMFRARQKADMNRMFGKAEQVEHVDVEFASPGLEFTTMRECGICKVRDIPRGTDWQYWEDGRPVHHACMIDSMYNEFAKHHPEASQG